MSSNIESSKIVAEQRSPNSKTMKQKLRKVWEVLFACLMSKHREGLTIGEPFNFRREDTDFPGLSESQLKAIRGYAAEDAEMISNRVSLTASSTGLSCHTANSTTTVHQDPDEGEETKDPLLPPIPSRWRSEFTEASQSTHSRTYTTLTQAHRSAIYLPSNRPIATSHSVPIFRKTSPPTRPSYTASYEAQTSLRPRAWGTHGTDLQFTPRETSPLAESMASELGYFASQRPTGLGITCAGYERERGQRSDYEGPFYIS